MAKKYNKSRKQKPNYSKRNKDSFNLENASEFSLDSKAVEKKRQEQETSPGQKQFPRLEEEE